MRKDESYHREREQVNGKEDRESAYIRAAYGTQRPEKERRNELKHEKEAYELPIGCHKFAIPFRTSEFFS